MMGRPPPEEEHETVGKLVEDLRAALRSGRA